MFSLRVRVREPHAAAELREAAPAAAERISAPRILSQLPGKSVVP